MEWLQANWLPLLIVVLVAIGFIIYLIYLSKKKGLRRVALEAILLAEEKWNTTTGKERMQIAIEYVYEYIPSYVKIFLSKDLLNKLLTDFIQKVFDEVKKFLDFQKFDFTDEYKIVKIRK